MNNLYEPEVGEIVWFKDDFERLVSCKVTGFEVVDQFNGYKMFSVETEYGDTYNLFPTAFYRNKQDLLKHELTTLMNDRIHLDNRIARLESQLSE